MDPKVVALFNHWCHADAIRVFVHQKVPEVEQDPGLPEYLAHLGEFSSSMSRLVVFYGLIYVVIEGYQELDLRESAVDTLLSNEDMVSHLRRFRNSVFHYQSTPLSNKHLDFLTADGSEKWVKELWRALDRFFQSNLPIKEHIDELKRLAT